MYNFLLKTIPLTITLLSMSLSQCMVIKHQNKAFVKKHIEKIQAKFRKKKLLDQLNQRPLLLENSPFNFSQLPDDLQLKIFAIMPPNHKNQLQKTCTFLHKKGTKQSPNIWDIACYNPLCIAQKDTADLILKATLCNRTDVLEKLLQNNKKTNLTYEYAYTEYPIDRNLEKNYYFNIYDADFDPMKINTSILKKNQATINNPLYGKCIEPTKLMMACYAQDHKMIADIISSHRNITDDELDQSLFIAIHHENQDIIKTICDLKNQRPFIRNTRLPGIYTIFFDNARKMNKIKAFEALIANNTFLLNKASCGRIRYESDTYLTAMILDNKDKQNINFFAEIVRAHGGKTTRELKGLPDTQEDPDILWMLWGKKYIIPKSRGIFHHQNKNTRPNIDLQSAHFLAFLDQQIASTQQQLADSERRLQNHYNTQTYYHLY